MSMSDKEIEVIMAARKAMLYMDGEGSHGPKRGVKFLMWGWDFLMVLRCVRS